MGEVWQAPNGKGTRPIDPEVDEATIQRGLGAARKVAVGLLLCGLMHGASLGQILLFTYRQTPMLVIGELGCVVFAALFIFVGSRIYDGSHAFTLAGVAVGFGGALFAFAWFIFLMLFWGTVSLIAFLVTGASGLCGVACLVLLPSTARVAAARRRLFE